MNIAKATWTTDMDDIIDRIGSRISAWIWFARSTSLGSDALVNDLLDEVGTPARRPMDLDLHERH